MISHFLRELVLPPSSLLLIFLVSFLLLPKKPRLGRGLLAFGMGLSYLLSIPFVSLWLTRSSERVPASSLETLRASGAEVVVILGGGADFHNAEYSGQTVSGHYTLKRLQYGAYLARELELPILVTGGYGEREEDSEGATMARDLGTMGFSEVWIESQSRNTRENAQMSAAQLRERKKSKILLVTHASHMSRALGAFERTGLEVVPAPTAFRTRGPWERGVLLFIPSHSQFDKSCAALRAHLASIWYFLRG